LEIRSGELEYTEEVIAAILATGEAFFYGQRLEWLPAMRVSVCNWRTSDEDVERAVRAVASVLAEKTKLSGEEIVSRYEKSITARRKECLRSAC
jgi:hypothetical protein